MTISVFLIEDMKPMRGALAELLAHSGDFKVVGTASTEAEANLWLQENAGKWDLVIVDLILEQGTGMRVIGNARKISPTAHIVVFSDFASPGIEAHCMKLGADAVFDKSRGPNALLEHCVSLLE